MVPKDVKTVLDIGSRNNIFRKYKTTTLDAIEEADIEQDLNENQELPFEDNSFDLVVANQILEHLPTIEKIIKEMKRVSKKYILVGLPNETVYSLRLKFLLTGDIGKKGYRPYGHKHRFNIKSAEKFIRKYFGREKKKVYYGAFTGASLLPSSIIQFLAKICPNLFAKEVYCLIEKN